MYANYHKPDYLPIYNDVTDMRSITVLHNALALLCSLPLSAYLIILVHPVGELSTYPQPLLL